MTGVSFYSHSQQLNYRASEINSIAKLYYRSNPFITPFSDFLNHLMKDSTLSNTVTHKRTDSTLFFFEGDYSKHRPFGIPDSRTHVVLAEREEEAIDSGRSVLRTIFIYQLVSYSPAGEAGTKDVKKAFERFTRSYQNDFANKNYREFTRDSKQVGEITDFQLYPYLSFSHLTAAWANTEKGDNLFTITIRFIVSNNLARIPYLPGLVPID